MPSRILRDFRDSALMATLSDFEERLFIRMLVTADDFGRGLANNLHATCFPLSDIPKADVQQALYSMAAKGENRLVRLFKDKTGRILFDIPNFGNTPRAKGSKWPSYEECEQIACNLHADVKQVHAECTSKPEPVFREPETEDRKPEPIVCTEPPLAATVPPLSPTVLTFACVGKVKEWHLTEAMVAEWAASFPAVSVTEECRRAKCWEDANPAKRKTAQGHPGFLLRWIAKVQDRQKSGDDGKTWQQRADEYKAMKANQELAF